MANSTDYKVIFSGQDNVSGTVKKVKNELDSVGKSAQTATERIDKQFNRIVNSTAPLKRQLRDLQALMAKMNFEGLSGTKQFTEIADYAGKVKDALSDAGAAVQRFSSDTMSLQAGIQAMQGLAAAGSIASGVMGMLGTKNQQVTQAILKVQSAMAILNGVQQIANLLNKDSILMLKLKDIQLKISNALTTGNTIATTANTVATTANTAAQRAWNVTKAIGKAMLGDFSGLLLLGAAALMTYGIATADASDKQDQLTNSMQKTTSFSDKWIESSKEATKTIDNEKYKIAALNNVLQDANASYKDKVTALNELKKIIPSVNGYIDNMATYHGNAVSAIREHIKALDDLQKALALFKLGQKIQEELTESQFQEFKANEEVGRHQNNIAADRRAQQRAQEQMRNQSVGVESSPFDYDVHVGGHAEKSQAERNRDQARENERINQEKLDAAKEEQKAAHQNVENAEKQKQQLDRFAKTQNVSSHAMASVALAGGDASKATDIFFGRDIEGSRGRGKTGKGGKTTPAKTEKKEVEAIKDSLADIEKRYNTLRDNIRKGIFSTEGQEADIKKLNELKQQITAKEIELGFKVDPKKEEFEKARKELEDKVSEIKFNPDISDFERAVGAVAFDRKTLAGIREEMDFNEKLITQLNEVIKLYEKLGLTGEESFSGLKQKLEEYNEAQSQLAEKAEDMTKQQEEWDKRTASAESYNEVIGYLSESFSGLSGAIGGATGQFLQFAAAQLDAIAKIIPMISKLIIAKEAESLASGTAEGAKMPFPANIAAIAAIVATILASFASIPKFAEGGIITGGSMHGDQILAGLNAGEMVLNKRQQSNLFDILDSTSNRFDATDITFRIKGSDLYGSLKNFSKTQSKIGKTTGIL